MVVAEVLTSAAVVVVAIWVAAAVTWAAVVVTVVADTGKSQAMETRKGDGLRLIPLFVLG
jgi:hypothetical protein